MKRSLCLFGCLLLLLCAGLRAQAPAVLLSVNEGLSQGMVYDILQTRDGYLWIATKDGLNRYDGYRFEVFSNDSFDPFSLAANEVRRIHEDSRGWIWAGYEGGVGVLAPETGRFFHLPLSTPQEFTGYIKAFVECPDGSMWLLCEGHIWRIEAVAATLRQAVARGQPRPDFRSRKVDRPIGPQGGAPLPIHSLLSTRRGELLAGAGRELYRWEQAQWQVDVSVGSLPTLLGEETSGWVWAQTNEGLLFRKGSEVVLMEMHLNQNMGWRFDKEGNPWSIAEDTLRQWHPAASPGRGQYARQLRYAVPTDISEIFYLTSTEIDRTGNVWIGTSGYGLLKVSVSKPRFVSYQPVVSHGALAEDPAGNLFSLQHPRYIYADRQMAGGRTNPWMSKLPEGNPIFCAVFDSQGNLWGNYSDGRLCRIDARSKEPQFFDWGAIGIGYGRGGKIMGAGEEALLVFDPRRMETTAYAYPTPLKWRTNSRYHHNHLWEDSQGVVWIYAFEGLLKATPQGQGYRFEHYRNNPADLASLSSNHVLSIAEDPLEPRRYLWVGTKGGGLNRLDRETGKFQHFKKEDGLPDNVIYGILTDPAGRLWLSTNKGLCRMTADGGRYRFKNFTVADGLQSNEFNTSSYLKMKDGTLVFGGVNGVTIFHPDSLRFNETPPQTQLTGLWINDEARGLPATQLALSHRQNLVAVEFAALDFTNPSQNQYRYQLLRAGALGSESKEAWVELGHRNSVQFANLRPGRYTFRVLGSNNDGIWSETPAILEFRIRPPWWATWWAWLLYAIAISTVTWAVYRIQLRRKLESQEALRLRELDEFKNRFFTNITHEFRTPLTVILGTSEQLERIGIPIRNEIGMAVGAQRHPDDDKNREGNEQEAEEEVRFPKSRFKQQIGLIRRNGDNLLRLINQILDLAKLEGNTLKIIYLQGDVVPYIRYIVESLHSFAEARGVTLCVESQIAEIVMDYDPERLLQIVHNLLSNAIKFTPSGGEVVLRIGLLNLEGLVNLDLQVSDTGIGIPPEDLPHIFDRFYQANNLEKAKAGGTGIGLALTKELVAAMGGRISVQSEPGAGAVFRVILPVTQHAEKSELANTTPPMAAAEPNAGGNMGLSLIRSAEKMNAEQASVLLIEDNPDVLEYLAACLAPHYTLDFASNGRTGIEKAIETVPDLIVSDVMMPEKDGFEVCETLKNDERTSHIPLVLLTAKVGVENRIAGLRRGADTYLGKPFHEEELLATLTNLLETRKKLQAKYAARPFIPGPSLITPDPIAPDPEDVFLQKVRAVVEKDLANSEWDMQHLEQALAMSRSQVFRKIKALTGRSPSQFVRSIRLQHGRRMLIETELTVSEIAYEVGFSSVKYFSDAFLEEFGERPTVVRG